MAKRKTKSEAIAAGYDYGTVKIRNKDGSLRTSRGSGDAVAKAMLIAVAAGMMAKQIATANDVKMVQGDRNEGLFRMAVGNSLRAKVRAGEKVKIGSITVTKLSQKVDMPKVEAKTPRPAKGKSKAKRAAAPRRRKAKPAASEAPAEAAVA